MKIKDMKWWPCQDHIDDEVVSVALQQEDHWSSPKIEFIWLRNSVQNYNTTDFE